MPITFVQSIGFNRLTGLQSTATSASFTPTVGDLVVVTIEWYKVMTDAITVADTNGNVWNKVPNTFQQYDTGGGGDFGQFGQQLWYSNITVGGSTVVTATLPATGNYPAVYGCEISGVNAVDNSTSASGHGVINSGNLTTVAANTFVYGSCYDDSGNSSFPGSGWTIIQDQFTQYLNEYQILSSTTTLAADTSDVGTVNFTAAIASFYESSPSTDKTHNLDADIQVDSSKSHNLDALPLYPSTDKTHNIDADISRASSSNHSLDAFISNPFSIHHLDAYIFASALPTNVHSLDAYVLYQGEMYVQEELYLIPPILDPNAFLRQNVALAQAALGYINEAALLTAVGIDYVTQDVLLGQKTVGFVKESVQLMNGGSSNHYIDADIAVVPLSFVQQDVLLVQDLNATGCDGSYPDVSFVKAQVWLVAPGNNSHQAPGSGLTLADDWASQADALSAYLPIGRFTLAGIPMIITGFTSGVISWQTKTRQWLRLVDYEPGGVVVSSSTKTQKLANGQTITTNTVVTQIQDTTVTTVTVTDSTNPDRISKSITERTQGGSITTHEQDIVTINGVRTTTDKKTVQALAAPSKENIQPIKVTTLDGTIHYQFFGGPNIPNWAGGEAEGTSQTTTAVSISANTRHTEETVSTPDGKIIQTTTDETGIRDAGTTTTDTAEQYDGIQKTTTKTVTYPDGSQEVTKTISNSSTGDSTEVITETSTDENGQQTITTTTTDTKTFMDPGTGVLRTTVTKTVDVNGPSGTYTDTTTEYRDNFEDDLISQKIKVYLIQEFTVNCVIDRFSKEALEEIAIGHQKNFAVAELIGQQLGNMDLSWFLRNNLISQYNEAINCISPIEFDALGKSYRVVFAPSASSFRAKYIVGILPAVYELQMIIQERSDLVTGLAGF